MVGCEFLIKTKKLETDWLSSLLQDEPFGSCLNHQELKKNEKNVFCIECKVGFCKHCFKSHRFHRHLQILKYVYHDVVRLQDLQKYLDCSKIQTYKINGEKAVHLNPRPQAKDAKPSTKAKFAGSCRVCARYLQDISNHFCSIACKVSVIEVGKDKEVNLEMVKLLGGGSPISLLKDNTCSTNIFEGQSSENESTISSNVDITSFDDTKSLKYSALNPRPRIFKRKGTPHRAPH